MKYTDWKSVYVDKTQEISDWFSNKSFKDLVDYLGKLDNVTVRK